MSNIQIDDSLTRFISDLKLNNDNNKEKFGLELKTLTQEKIFYVYKNSNDKIIAKPINGNESDGKGKARTQTVSTGLEDYILHGIKNSDHSSYNIAIKQYIKDNYYLKNFENEIIYPDEVETNLLEGAKKEVVVNSYERNPIARKKCLEYFSYNCSVCNINFEKVYGIIGKNFIHVHHLKQISDIQKEYEVNPTEDLIPVCPNCHAMLHKRNPPYSIDELKDITKHRSQ